MESEAIKLFMQSISVIIPNYNNGRYLRRCIESINAQTYPISDIVIVDDKSTDDSAAIIATIARECERVHPVYLEKNGGVSHARNIGFDVSNGDYVTFLDADDFLYEIELLEKQPDCIAFSKLKYVDIDENELSDPNAIYLEGDITFKLLLGRKKYYVTHYYLINRAYFEEVGGYSEQMNFYEDLDLIFRLSLKHRFIGTGIYGTAYRQSSSGLSKQGKRSHSEAKREIEHRYLSAISPIKRLYVKAYWVCLDVYRTIRKCA